VRDILDKITRKKKKEDIPDPSQVVNEPGSIEEGPPSKSEGTGNFENNMEGPVPSNEPDETKLEQEAKISNFPASGPESGVEVTQISAASIEDTAVGEAPMTVIADLEMALNQQKAPILQVGQCCHLGNVRGRNEDSIFVLNTFSGGENPIVPFGLYIVADGMGGHHAGHKASKSASTIMIRDVTEKILLPLISNESGRTTTPQKPIGEVMLGAIQAANNQIYNPDPEKEGGTTVTAALIIGRRLYIAHVGDSRAYLLINNQFKQVTTDHSYVRRLMEAGQITEEEAAIHPQRNMLYRAVGAGGDLEVETYTQTLPDHGNLILCSDGLWGLVPDPVLEEELRGNKAIQGSAESLVDIALRMGGYDNISIVIVEFTF
jgi:protein phosphatase